MILTTWQRLGRLFHESMKYRGDNSIPLSKLEDLLDAIIETGGLKDPNTSIDPAGGSFACRYQFDPSIWGKWFPSQDAALAFAVTDKDVVNQYAGRSQGHTAHKVNWGGRVVNTPGKARSDFEALPSAMDRYDVLMQGDVVPHAKRNRATGELKNVEVGTLHRIAYSPAIGSSEARRARLVALLAGQAPGVLPRRPQPHRPEPTKKDIEKADRLHHPAHAVPRVGQNLKQADDDVDVALGTLGGSAGDTSSFRSKMAKHNAEYQPAAKRDPEGPDDDQALFPKKRK